MGNYPQKTCEFCGKVGKAYTWDVTICPACFATMPTEIGKCWKRIAELEENLEAQETISKVQSIMLKGIKAENKKMRYMLERIVNASRDYRKRNTSMGAIAEAALKGEIYDA